jgi:phage-related minor tail protein
MANHQNAATLGVALSLETGNFVTEAQKVAYETQKLKNSIAREMRAADKEIQALKYATEDYGKAVTKVTELERQLESGRLKSIKGTDKAKELLAQAAAYDQIASAQKKVTTGMTEQQKLSLTYQTTDLFTQIASGGNPMIALIQQGGQLKDSMGGLGNMFRMLGTFITPVNAAIAATVTAVTALGYAFYKGAQDSAKLRDDLILTGNFAGTTASKIELLSKNIGDDLSMGYTKARDVLGSLVESGSFSERSFESVSRTILQFSKVSGLSAKEAADKLIPSLDGTANSAKSLNDKYHFLTLAQYKQIEALDLQGKTQEAIILTSNLLGQSLSSQERQLGTVEKMWKSLGDTINYVKEAILSIGRPETTSESLTKLSVEIARLNSELGGTDTSSIANRSANREALAKKQAEFALLTQKLVNESEAAAKKAADEEQNASKIKRYKEFGAKEAQLAGELKKQIAETEFVIAMNSSFELGKITLEADKKIADARIEMTQKNESEKNQFTLVNKKIFDQKELQAEAEKTEKLKQFWSKRGIEQAQILADAQQDYINEANARGKLLEQSSQAATDSTKNLQNQQTLLQLKYSMLYATEKEQKLAEMNLKYDMQRKENVGKENEQFLNDQIAKQQSIEKFNIEIEDSAKKLKEVYDSVWGNMSSAIDNFVKTGKLSFKDLARSIIQDLIAIQLKAQATGIMNMVINSFINPGANGASGNGTGVTGFGSAYADGGSPTPNTINLVGERGPELFIPKTAGTIIPNNALGGMGGTTNVTNYNINAIDTKSFEERILGSSTAVWAANQYGAKSLATNYGRT